jgi:hypothetical protein
MKWSVKSWVIVGGLWLIVGGSRNKGAGEQMEAEKTKREKERVGRYFGSSENIYIYIYIY